MAEKKIDIDEAVEKIKNEKENPLAKKSLENPTFMKTCSFIPEAGLKDEVITYDKIEKLNVLVVKKIDDEASCEIAKGIMQMLQDYNHIIYLEGATLREMKSHLINIKEDAIVEFDPVKHEMEIELLFTVGGDGTILWTVSYFQNRPMPPMFTIDRGTLGYMCNFSMKTYKDTVGTLLDRIKNRQTLSIERKFRIHCEICGSEQKQEYLALNEFLIDRGPSPFVSKLDVFLEDKLLTTYHGDGIIIATPNGSTAYQLSAGGPIIHQLV